jgi:hypothetical protein
MDGVAAVGDCCRSQDSSLLLARTELLSTNVVPGGRLLLCTFRTAWLGQVGLAADCPGGPQEASEAATSANDSRTLGRPAPNGGGELPCRRPVSGQRLAL